MSTLENLIHTIDPRPVRNTNIWTFIESLDLMYDAFLMDSGQQNDSWQLFCILSNVVVNFCVADLYPLVNVSMTGPGRQWLQLYPLNLVCWLPCSQQAVPKQEVLNCCDLFAFPAEEESVKWYHHVLQHHSLCLWLWRVLCGPVSGELDCSTHGHGFEPRSSPEFFIHPSWDQFFCVPDVKFQS